jgi:hypothetical protein
MKKFILIFSSALFVTCFFGLQKGKAANSDVVNYQDVVINEMMWAGSSRSIYDEWIVLYNTSDKTVDISNWKIKYWTTSKNDFDDMLSVPSGKFIHSKDYFLISNYDFNDSRTILNIRPDLVDSSTTLTNNNLQIKLFNADSILIDIAGDNITKNPFSGSNITGKKSAMQRNDIIGEGVLPESWHSSSSTTNLISGVTDLANPQNSHNLPPSAPGLILPVNNYSVNNGEDIQFVWENSTDPENDPFSYSLLISCTNEFDEKSVVDSEITDNYYKINSKEIVNSFPNCEAYRWAVMASDGMLSSDLYGSTFIITEAVVNNTYDQTSATTQITNETPIEISTGDFQNYQNKLIKVTGEVVDTSGDTFYLDDGTGEVKIYIQSKTGIDKPTMHTGDIFEVIGIVDLYGTNNWRILPQNQDDIKLITPASRVVKNSTAKAIAKKASTDKIELATDSSKSLIPKVEAASSANLDENKTEKTQPAWVQIIYAILGLALIGLIYLILKARHYKDENSIGGHFGEDDT